MFATQTQPQMTATRFGRDAIASLETTPELRSQPVQQAITNQPRSFADFNAAERMQQLGSISWLMLQSELHCRYTISDLVDRIMPSLLRGQYRYYERSGEPIGFFNWAWLTDEMEAQVLTGNYVLQPDEWTGGKNLWFMEFIAPYGHGRLMVRDLRRNLFTKGTPAKALRIDPKTGELRSIARYTL